MKPTLYINQSLVSLIVLLTLNIGIAQTNTSQEHNYKIRSSYNKYYVTQYDNGYVVLLDGTRMEGLIALSGASFGEIWNVILKSENGEKYSFSTNSLTEFGLKEGILNETPNKIRWEETGKTSREAYVEFGYVYLKNGDKIIGRLSLKEGKGQLNQVIVTHIDNTKSKPDIENVRSFGAQPYSDPKFKGFWKNYSTQNYFDEFYGFVQLKYGAELTGNVTVNRKGIIIKKIAVNGVSYDYDEVETYGAIHTIDEYYKLISLNRNSANVFMYPEEMLFAPGYVILSDGSRKSGLVANVSDIQDSPVWYAQNESAPLEFISAEDVVNMYQDLPEEIREKRDQFWYNLEYPGGYAIQDPARWEYEKESYRLKISKKQLGFVRVEPSDVRTGMFQWKVEPGAKRTHTLTDENGVETEYPSDLPVGLLESDLKITFDEYLNLKYRPGNDEVIASSETSENFSVDVIANTGAMYAMVHFDNGDVIEGEVSLSGENDNYYNAFTLLNGSTNQTYTNDETISKIKLNSQGRELLLVEYQGVYVKVFDIVGSYVHFKNPFPTTPATGAIIGKFFATQLSAYANQKADERAILNAAESSAKGEFGKEQQKELQEFMSRRRFDLGEAKIFDKLFAKENVIMNVEKGYTGVYVVKGESTDDNGLKGLLMGHKAFLDLSKEEKRHLLSMDEPLRTLRFLEAHSPN